MATEREHTHAQHEPTIAPTHDDLAPGLSSRSARLDAPANPIMSGLIARKASRDDNGVADGADGAIATAASSSGTSLPEPIMRKFESSVGTDLSSVRVHTGPDSAAAASAVGAKAYTMGQDIHFGAGQYDPSSGGGQHLLAHEVAHTVQQRGGSPVRQNKLEVSSPHDAAEHEADRAADAMVSGAPTTIGSASGFHRQVFRDPLATPPADPTPGVAAPGAATPAAQPAAATPRAAAPTTALAPAAPGSSAIATGSPAAAPQQDGPQSAGLGTAGKGPSATITADSSQFLRPAPVPLDPSVAGELSSLGAGRKAFGASNDWKDGIEWDQFNAWIGKVPQVEAAIEQTINPKVGSDRAVVQHIHDAYQQRMTDAFAQEQARIDQIVKTDTAVMGYVTHINTQTELIKAEFNNKSTALDRIDAATNDMAATVAAGEARTVDEEKAKQEGYQKKLEAEKAAAIASLEGIPEMIVEGATTAANVAKEGPAALAEPGAKLAKALVMGAYKAWVDKSVEARFSVQINNVQFKIRNLEARLKNLKDAEFAARVKSATDNAKAAARDLQVAGGKIQTYANDINQTRVQLGILIKQKYKDVSVFRLATEATDAMKPALTKYLGDLGAAKTQLKQLDPWQTFRLQLQSAAAKASGTEFLQGGDAPTPGLRKPSAHALDQAAQIDRYSIAVGKVGQYVESENAHYDAEIEKVQSGAYLDFVQQIDQKVLAMLPTVVPQ